MKIVHLNSKKLRGKRLLLIDGNNLAHRCFHGAKQASVDSQKQISTLLALNQILTFKNLCLNSIVVFFWDSSYSYRAELFDFYKQHKLKDDNRNEIIDHIKNVFMELNFQSIEQYGYEGDDLISLYSMMYSKTNKCIIYSTDNDLLQCLKCRVVHYNPLKSEVNTYMTVKEKMGLNPQNIALKKALIGKKNEVPGIPKVGEVTAMKIINNEIPFPDFDMCLFDKYLEVSTLPFQHSPDPLKFTDIEKYSNTRENFKKVFKENDFRNFLTEKTMKIWSKAFNLK